MKKNDFIQIKALEIKELILKSKTIEQEIADLTLDKNMKKIKDLRSVAKLRKNRAQVLTVLGQKQALFEIESKVEEKI